MTGKLTKSQARAFQKRWRLVNAHEHQESSATSMDVKWQQFNALLRMARTLRWLDASADSDEVWQRWARLRKALRGKKEER